MSAGSLDLRRPRRSTSAGRLVAVGEVTAACMLPLVWVLFELDPFGSPCDGGLLAPDDDPPDDGPPAPCPASYGLEARLARGAFSLLIVDAVVLAAAVVWALRRARRDQGLGTAIVAMAGLVALSASAPNAVLGSEWLTLVWLTSPLVLLLVRRVTGRIWPALLSLLPAAVVLAAGLLLEI